MAGSSNIFYNYTLQIESQRPFFAYRLVNEAGRTVTDGEFRAFEEMGRIDRYIPRVVGDGVPETVVEGMAAMGRKMFDAVFRGPVWREFMRIMDVGGIVSLKLVTHERRIMLLPWEALHDGDRFLVTTGQFLLNRGSAEGEDLRLSRLNGTPRVLLAVLVPPEKEPAVRVEHRANALYGMLTRMHDEGVMDVSAVTASSAAELIKHTRGYLPHIVLIVAVSAGGGLLLSLSDMLTTTKLTGSLLSCSDTRCVIFSSPMGDQDTFMDACWEMVLNGLPAAFCMRFCLTDEMEVRALEAFFESLLRGARLDAAVFAGRSALFSEGQMAFIAPVSYILTTEPLLPQSSEEEVAARKEHTLKERSASSTGLNRARLLLSLAHHYHKQRRFDDALTAVKDAMDAFEEEGEDGGFRAARALLGESLLKLDRPTEALDIFQKLLADHPDKVDPLQVFVFAKLGQSLMIQGRTFEALNAFREALRVNTEVKDQRLLVGILLGLGQVCEAMGSLEEAERMLQQGMKVAERLGEEETGREIKLVLATVQIRLGKYSEARQTLSALLGESESAEDTECGSYCNILLGVIQDLLGEKGPAAYHFQEALQKAISIRSTVLRVSALFNLAVLSRDGLNYDEAVYYAYLARQTADKADISVIIPKIDSLLEAVREKVGDELFEVYLASAKEKADSA